MSDFDRLLRYFAWTHLPPSLQRVSRPCGELAHGILTVLLESRDLDRAEVMAGLRKLLEAKDCFVRAVIPPKKD